MVRYKKGFLGLLFIFLLPVHNANGTEGEPNLLTIGRASKGIYQGQQGLQPIVDYLAAHLSDQGITSGKAIQENKHKDIINQLLTGELDIVLETPYGAHQYIERGAAVPLLMIQREGVDQYGSLIFVRKDSPIQNPDELKGKVIAFEDPSSTSAYYLPKFSLECSGLKFTELESSKSAVSADRIGYTFAGAERNISSWVFSGKVSAGAFSELDWNNPKKTPPNFRRELRIIHQTVKVPRMIALVRSSMKPKLQTRIKEELLAMSSSDVGKKNLLQSKLKIDRFRKIPPQVKQSFLRIFSCPQINGAAR